MDRSSADQVYLQPGMEVVSLDGDKIGKIVQVDASQITVEKGLFFPKDYIIPMTAVDSADDDTVYLNLSKDDAVNQNWGATTDANWSARTSDASADLGVSDATASTTTSGMAGSTGTTRTAGTSDDTLTIPVHEEELTATKRSVEAGNVVINTQVVSEDRTLEVPITEERVRVARRVVDRAAAGDAAAFTGGTIEVPVSTEQVDLQKRVHVAEEVEVAKEAVQKTQQVSGTVRREVVEVADNTDVDVIDGTGGAAAKGGTSKRR